MTQREEAIGALIFGEIFKHAKELGLSDSLTLRSALVKARPFSELPDDLRRRFTQVGVEFLRKLPTVK
jgi:hypothetical protein